MSEVTIIEAGSPELIGHARALFREYGASIHFHLCFASFEDELAGLPGRYAPPLGRLLLAGECGNLVGCVALGPVDRVTAELKRLYVRPAARGRGIGRRLAGTAVPPPMKARAVAPAPVRCMPSLPNPKLAHIADPSCA